MSDTDKSIKNNSYAKKLMTASIIIIAAVFIVMSINILVLNKKGFFGKVRQKYPVRGVSLDYRHVGIDWNALAGQFDFVYIKASEGAAFTDKAFGINSKLAEKEDIPVGYCHFLTPDPDGRAQAENFFSAAGDLSGKLVPAVEADWKKFKNNSKAEKVITDFLDCWKENLNCLPVIICGSGYTEQVAEQFPGCPLWVTDYDGVPKGDRWVFWGAEEDVPIDTKTGTGSEIIYFYGPIEELKKLTV